MKFLDTNVLVYVADIRDPPKTEDCRRSCDSLLLATAEANGCSEFISEDLNDGQIYCGMKIVNPFKA